MAMVGNEGTTALPIHAQELPYKDRDSKCGRSVTSKAAGYTGGIQEKWTTPKSSALPHTHSLFTQIAQSAVCNRFHNSDQRFCRWLLCTRDHVEFDTLNSLIRSSQNMLGVQRSVVSVTAGGVSEDGTDLLIVVDQSQFAIPKDYKLHHANVIE